MDFGLPRKALAWTLAGLLLWAGAASGRAVSAADPFLENITNRNAFGLRPMPPPPDPSELNKPKPSNILLKGIMTILGKKQALMTAPPLPPTKPGEQPREQSYMLAEGQRDGEIEVLHIDVEACTVKISNAGTVETLTFSTNNVAGAQAAGGAGIPKPGGFTRPGQLPNPFRPSYNGGARAIPRTLRLPSMGGASSSGLSGGLTPMAGGNALGTPGVGAPGIGTAGVGTTLPGFGSTPDPTAQTPATQPDTTPPRTTEENVLLFEAAELRREQTGIGPHLGQHVLLRGQDPAPDAQAAPAVQLPPRPPGMPQVPQ